MKKKILFVTGIRSEYDILYSVMKAVQKHSLLELAVVVTGAHLSPMYGNTAKEIEKDNFPIISNIESLLNADTASSRVKSAALQLSGLVDVFAQYQPDFVISPMDREEAMTVALAGAYMRIPVVHIGGGDIANDGNIDNAIRHAVTKLSHLHMVTTQASAERVIRMGEESWRVHVVGASGLDRLKTVPQVKPDELWEHLNCPSLDQPFAIVIQHSIISDIEDAGIHMALTLDSIVRQGVPTLISYPNTDAGSQHIINVIDDYVKKYPDNFILYKNLPRHIFVNLLRNASVLIGNSSCGIIEAPMFHLPVINIGPRQTGREHAENVQFVDHDRNQIIAAIDKALHDRDYLAVVKNVEIHMVMDVLVNESHQY